MWYSIIMGKQILIIKGSPADMETPLRWQMPLHRGRAKANYVQTMVDSFRQYIACFGADGGKEGGIFFAFGTRKPSDVDKMPVLEEVYEAGKRIERNEVKRC